MWTMMRRRECGLGLNTNQRDTQEKAGNRSQNKNLQRSELEVNYHRSEEWGLSKSYLSHLDLWSEDNSSWISFGILSFSGKPIPVIYVYFLSHYYFLKHS